MTQFEQWIEALRARGLKPTRRGHYWTARCPAHNDRRASLSVSEGREGRVLVKCHAGCSFEAIRAALDSDVATAAQRRSESHGLPPASSEPEPPPTPKPLPSGRNITLYHYVDADGSKVLVVARRQLSATDKTFSQWSPVEGGWIARGLGGSRKLPLYRLPELLAADPKLTVAIVEGEKCVHACLDAWPNQPVTTSAGGAAAWASTDWTPLAGRNVSIVADGNEQGHAYAVNVAELLLKLGCKVEVTLSPLDGTDIADWLETDRAGTPAKVKQYRRPYPFPDPEDTVLAEAAEIVAAEEEAIRDEEAEPLRANKHFRLLGIYGEAIGIQVAGQVLYRKRESLTSASTLIALAPQNFWLKLARAPAIGTVQARALGDDILRQAERIGPFDPTKARGRGAVKLPDGGIVYHLGDRLLDRGVEIGLDDERLIWLSEPRLELADNATDDEVRAVASAVLRYRWLTVDDGRRMLGWITAAICGGALEWRPHLSLSAPAESGKSWMLKNVVGPLMGDLAYRLADATPAAVARLTQNSSLAVLIDEAEPTETWVLDVLKQLRISAGAEGLRVRADATSGGVVAQAPRYCALLSATKMAALGAADASRLAMIRLGDEVDDWPTLEMEILGAMAAADRIRSRIVRSVDWVVNRADELTRELQQQGIGSRAAALSASLTAGWQFWGIDRAIVPAGTARAERSDAESALLELLALTHREAGAHERSVRALLRDDLISGRSAVGDLYGMRREGDDLLVMPRHSGLATNLRRARSALADVDLGRLLRQIAGVEVPTNGRRIGGERGRVVVFPFETLARLGIDWDIPEEEIPRDTDPPPRGDPAPPPDRTLDDERNF